MARDRKFYTIFVSPQVFRKLQLLAMMDKHRDVSTVVSKLVIEKIKEIEGADNV
mgnify:CR=1 FL=1